MHRAPWFAALLVAACGTTHDTPAATRTDSAGIEMVDNSGTDRSLPWQVATADTLVAPDRDTLLQGEARAVSLGVDDAGRIVLADGIFNDRRVIRREPDGSTHLLGRRGGGPGEYQMIAQIAVSPSGEVMLLDYGKRAFVRYASSDSALPQIDWSTLGHGFVRDANYAAGGLLLYQGERTDSTSVQTLRLLTARDTTLLARLPEPGTSMAFFEVCKVGLEAPPMYFPNVVWAGGTDRVAVAHEAGYRIEVWRGGRLRQVIRRAIAPRAATKALAMQDLGEGRRIGLPGKGMCLIPASEIVEKQGLAATIPAVKRLSIGPDGSMWVERWTVRGEPSLRDVFDPTGSYLGTLRGELPWPQAWMRDGRYLAVLADADSAPVVMRYGLKRSN